jgi:hypothetical protein
MNAEQLFREVGMVDDDIIEEAIKTRKPTVKNSKHSKKSRWVLLAACIAMLLAIGGTAYAASPVFREFLANILHIKVEETTYIGLSSSSSNITMTVESSHVCKDTAVVMLTFHKNNGEPFSNGLNPTITLTDVNGQNIFQSGMSGGVYTKLSDDKRTLFCFYTWSFPENFTDKTVILEVSELICNQSQINGVNWPEELIKGDWKVKFDLTENNDNTITISNPDLTKTLSVFESELQINSVSISDMLLIASTTTLRQWEMTDEEIRQSMLSSVYPGSSAYYNIYIQLVYNDGTMSEKVDFCRNDNDDLIAWFPETIPLNDVAEIRIGDIVIPTT